jgi:hypothetical protein
LHLSDLKLEKAELATEATKVIVTVLAPIVEVAAAATAEVPAGEATKEPELIAKGKKEAEEEEK